MPLNSFISYRSPTKAYPRRKRNLELSGGRRRTDVLPTGVLFHPWTLRFRQCSFSPITQALQGWRIHVFCASPLSQHAPVPASFQS
jgi:hypothetical protein